jgi:hypothetical protein
VWNSSVIDQSTVADYPSCVGHRRFLYMADDVGVNWDRFLADAA